MGNYQLKKMSTCLKYNKTKIIKTHGKRKQEEVRIFIEGRVEGEVE